MILVDTLWELNDLLDFIQVEIIELFEVQVISDLILKLDKWIVLLVHMHLHKGCHFEFLVLMDILVQLLQLLREQQEPLQCLLIIPDILDHKIMFVRMEY